MTEIDQVIRQQIVNSDLKPHVFCAEKFMWICGLVTRFNSRSAIFENYLQPMHVMGKISYYLTAHRNGLVDQFGSVYSNATSMMHTSDYLGLSSYMTNIALPIYDRNRPNTHTRAIRKARLFKGKYPYKITISGKRAFLSDIKSTTPRGTSYLENLDWKDDNRYATGLHSLTIFATEDTIQKYKDDLLPFQYLLYKRIVPTHEEATLYYGKYKYKILTEGLDISNVPIVEDKLQYKDVAIFTSEENLVVHMRLLGAKIFTKKASV